MLDLNRDTYSVQALRSGSSSLELPLYPGSESISQTITIEDNIIDIHKLDPIVATLRLGLNSIPDSRLEQGSVTLEVLNGVLFVQEEAVVTASVVFKDGHRTLIEDPSELVVSSSNSSIVSVNGNTLYGVVEGEATINITWLNPLCVMQIESAQVVVNVELDVSRPTFVPSTQTAVVPENSPIGHTVAVVMAVVQDEAGIEDRATDVQYRFQNGFNFDGLFSLDQTSGEVVLNGQLDRETTAWYMLMIEATNSAQRRAEQGDTDNGGDVISGSGSGSGDNGMLMPNPTPGENGNISLNIAVLTVSSCMGSYNIYIYISCMHNLYHNILFLTIHYNS